MKKIMLIGLALLMSVPFALASQAASLTLDWDPSTSAGVAGYNLYYKVADQETFTGVGIQQGDSPIDAGIQVSIDLDGLSDDTVYTFTVTSYDSNGVESAYSNEVSFTTTAADTGTPTPSLFIPALFYPAQQAAGLPTTVDFDWADPSDGRAVDYVLVFGTDPALASNTIAATALPGQASGVPLSAVPVSAAFALLGLAFPYRKKFKACFVGVLLATALLMSACGGGGDSSGTPTASNQDPGTSPVTLTTNEINNIAESTFQIYDLEPGTTYYWKVIADDGMNITQSEIHSFTTASN